MCIYVLIVVLFLCIVCMLFSNGEIKLTTTSLTFGITRCLTIQFIHSFFMHRCDIHGQNPTFMSSGRHTILSDPPLQTGPRLLQIGPGMGS